MTSGPREDQPAGAAEEEDLANVGAFALEIAREAGEQLMARFVPGTEIRYKSSRGRDPVTDVDTAVEALLRERVQARFPGDAFLGEEGSDRQGRRGARLWVVDPLDGTANFANRVPVFAVSVAALQDGRPVAAALFTSFGPAGRPCVVHAYRGSGLHVDGDRWTGPRQAARGRLVGLPAGFHRRLRRRLLRRMPPGETRSFGSIAVELALTATGTLQYAFFGSPKVWDVAGGVLLIQEAGGAAAITSSGRWELLSRFTVPDGRPLREWRGSLVAGEPEAVRAVQRALSIRRTPQELLEVLVGRDAASTVELRVKPVAKRLVWAAKKARPVLKAVCSIARSAS